MDPKAGDPIDLSSGLYSRTTVDLMVEDTIPIEISRTYRNADHRSRSFGVGKMCIRDRARGARIAVRDPRSGNRARRAGEDRRFG